MRDGAELAVVWDMGGVFSRYFTEPMVDVGRARGWPLDRVPMGPTGDLPDADYAAMCRGDLDEPDYLERCLARLARFDIHFHPRTDVDWTRQDRPDTWHLIGDLHEAGRTQGILTNDASKWLGERWWTTWEPAAMFTAVVDVATLGIRKPHPGTYQAVCEAMDRPPETCVFIDDMEVNCAGAEAIGMRSLRFDITDPAGSIHRARQMLDIA